MSLRQHIKLFFSWLTSVFCIAFSSGANADLLALSDSPLFLGTQIDPNVFFMMDDSGSMDWEILTIDYYAFDVYTYNASATLRNDGNLRTRSSVGPCTGTNTYYYIFANSDNTYDTTCSRESIEENGESMDNDWRVGSAEFNIMYYNPNVLYTPWVGYTNATFTSARSNPDNDTNGYSVTRNLEGFRFNVWNDTHSYNGSAPDGPGDARDGANGVIDLWDSFTEYTVNNGNMVAETRTVGTAGSGFTNGNCNDGDVDDDPPYKDCFDVTKSTTTYNPVDINPWGRTLTQEKQNIANWYQYARKRSFVSKNAVSLVVNSNPSFRFGLAQINDWDDVFVEVPSILLDDYAAHNAALVDTMASWEWEGQGTPLRRGLEVAGRYYDDYYGTYADPIVSECQQNYSVLFTDGYWGGSAPYTSAIGDEDGDGAYDTLADVAHYFYTEDLSPLDDEVPTTPIDPADHQHMVTFTVAFGVEGSLVDTDDDGYPNPEQAEDDLWGRSGSTVNTNPEKIDDLWHAAFNSKAYFVSAQSPNEVAAAIGEALLEIADRVGSAASVATNTGSLNAGSKLFQARFDSSDWKGQLLAFNINLDGTIQGTPAWDAGDEINSQNFDTGREIITFNPLIDNPSGGVVEGAGIPFRFPSDYTNPSATADLNSGQLEDLMANAPYSFSTVDTDEINANQTFGSDILDYFRGDESNELTGQGFRLRNSVLGDIVNSDPNFVDKSNNGYSDTMEAKSYNAFVTTNNSRQGVVYVGANDGMLHGFNSDTGAEMIAYLPSAVYENMAELATGDYIHRYFVDGGPNIIDMYFANTPDPDTATNGVWRTVLAGGLNGGGQQIYALDVTDPTTFDESNANDIVLWEFDDDDDVDMGYSFGKVQLAKLNNGSWAAVFGNGYNNSESDGAVSTTGHAVLYIVDVETGDLIKKIDTEAGSVATPNGLATPLLIDEDADQIADYAYAGDLQGNLWKFDLSSNSTSGWDVAWSSGGNPAPLFTTQTNQPITSQPQATFHPDNLGGFMIFVGTGKYLEENDNLGTGQSNQSFYGIWDVNTSTVPNITTSNLLQQTITNQYQQAFDTDGDQIDDETFTLRDVSDNSIDWDTHKGWYMDLFPTNIAGSPNVANFGERQVSNAIVRNGRVIFTTLVPSEVECEFGGTSFLMEIDFRDGGALEFPAFDLNGDGEYDADDTDASGRASDVGIMPTVSILADDAQDVAFGSGASGDIDVIQISVGDQSYGRQSWRQLE